MGGTGAAWVHDSAQLAEAVRSAIAESPIGQAWLEESVMGWKEYELEVMRDHADNFVVVCSIENLDPMGVHTGDSITVAPAQTLTDREYQILRDLAKRVMTAVGVETGGSNVQFGVDPKTGRVVVIEMNPRVSRSSALASKATGFPIAKLAALVAAGYTLDEIQNDITLQTQAAFEPSLDYVVVKIPRWAFEKFPGVDPILGPQMKSVGDVPRSAEQSRPIIGNRRGRARWIKPDPSTGSSYGDFAGRRHRPVLRAGNICHVDSSVCRPSLPCLPRYLAGNLARRNFNRHRI